MKMLATSRRARLDAVRLDAEPLQPGLPRGRARDAAALPRRGHRRHPLEPAGARLPRRQPPPRRSRRDRFARRPTTSRTSCTTPTRLHDRRSASSSSRATRGVKPAQIALAWLLAKPGVTAPIVGASKLPHLDEAVAALAIRLDADEIGVPRRALPAAPDPRALLTLFSRQSFVALQHRNFRLLWIGLLRLVHRLDDAERRRCCGTSRCSCRRSARGSRSAWSAWCASCRSSSSR